MQSKVKKAKRQLISPMLTEYAKKHAGKTVYALAIAEELSMKNKKVYDQLTLMEKRKLIEITWDELVMQVTFVSLEKP
jgi:hypothetical protein